MIIWPLFRPPWLAPDWPGADSPGAASRDCCWALFGNDVNLVLW